MMKQGLVQETLADISNPLLPPLTNLPQWSRINTLDKARYPKPFIKDRLGPISSQGEKSWQEENAAELNIDLLGTMEESQTDEGPGQMTARINHLERSLVFIQKEHQVTLQSLHAEIDQLKRENKDLHFQVIYFRENGSKQDSAPLNSAGSSQSQPVSGSEGDIAALGTPTTATKERGKISRKDSQNRVPKPPSGRRHTSASKTANKEDDLKLKLLEDENKELRMNLNEEVNRNVVLSKMLEETDNNGIGKNDGQMSAKSRPSESQSAPVVTQSPPEEARAMKARITTSASMITSKKDESPPQMLPYAATLDPLRVTIPPHPSRPPTLTECETIVRHLLIKTGRQSHELSNLKSDLREALFSHQWTPDAYLLAKAYVVNDDERDAAEKNHLPKIALSQQNRRIPESAYATREQTSLPPLKQTLGNKAIERRRRTQILQQTRRSKEVFH